MPTDTTCILGISVKNELQYHYLNVRINSGDDQATPGIIINLVGFRPVPLEFT